MSHFFLWFSQFLSQLYRCYIIYNRRWFVIIGPALMWIGTAGRRIKFLDAVLLHWQCSVCSSFTIYIEARLDTGVLSQSQLKPFITSTLVLTLATNVITTCKLLSVLHLQITDIYAWKFLSCIVYGRWKGAQQKSGQAQGHIPASYGFWSNAERYTQPPSSSSLCVIWRTIMRFLVSLIRYVKTFVRIFHIDWCFGP